MSAQRPAAAAGRRRRGALDAWLEQWARWLAEPASRGALGCGRSLLARWMDARGHLIFGGGGASAPTDGIEAGIELAVREIGKAEPMREAVLRLEHDAGWWLVVRERGLKGYDPRGLCQLKKALHLGISLRTYKRRLAEARAELIEHLGGRGK
jgi:hypothetical protein